MPIQRFLSSLTAECSKRMIYSPLYVQVWVQLKKEKFLQFAKSSPALKTARFHGAMELSLFQQRLHLVLQPHVIARQLVLSARYRPPQTLLGVGHKAQSQFPRHQPLHQAFGIWEIPLASPPPAIGVRQR